MTDTIDTISPSAVKEPADISQAAKITGTESSRFNDQAAHSDGAPTSEAIEYAEIEAQELAAIAASDDSHNEEDGIGTEEYSPSPPNKNEFNVLIKNLAVWKSHPCEQSRHSVDQLAHLILTAENPELLKPIIVLPAVDGIHPIIDGRSRFLAVKAANNDDPATPMRCILFEGSESDAAQTICDAALGSIGRSAIENAQAILNLQRIGNISQVAIASRYPKMTKDKISRMMIAARTREKHPAIFNLLEDPDQMTIDLGVKFSQFEKKASERELDEVISIAKEFSDAGGTFAPPELLSGLGIELPQDMPTKIKSCGPALKATSSEPVFGDDDEPIGALEVLSDNISRLRLPDATVMSLVQRQTARDAFVTQIDRYFELDAGA